MSDKGMSKKTKIVAGVAGAALAVGVAGGSVAVASGSDDNEAPITGAALERATQVALDHLGDGRVTETEVGDEDSYYEVEVTLSDGRQVDVQLDEQFNVLSAHDDVESPDDD